MATKAEELQVEELFKAGRTVGQIVTETRLTMGEVELIIQKVKKKKEEAEEEPKPLSM